MDRIYSTAKVPSYKNPKILLSLEPDLTDILAKSRDAKELEYYWKEWRKATGEKMRDDFIENIDLINEAARYEF
jgi:peptidyl-dipeptidase A